MCINVTADELLKFTADLMLTCPEIQKGSIIRDTLDAKSYLDMSITFEKPFKTVPTVVACLSRNITSTDRATNLEVVVLYQSVTKEGFTIRIYNNNQTKETPSVNWIAIGGGIE